MTASNFKPALAFTLRYEGGKADNPKDPGGRTNEGVTQRTFSAWLAGQGQPSRDVYTMTDAERDAIYRRGYWVAVGGDVLPAGIDLAVFDYGVNSGLARALKASAACPPGDAAAGVKRICADRLSFLHALATFKSFGRGWTARVAACEALGVKMAEHAAIGADPAAPATPATAGKLAATSRVAAGAAKGHAVGTVGALTLLAAGGATQTPATHLPLAMLLPLAGIVAVAAVLLAWRAHQHKARAAAYAAMAAVAAPPVPAPAGLPQPGFSAMPIALIMSLLPLLTKVAPDLIGLFFGGNAQAVADKVGKAASDVFGTQDAEAITRQTAADPAKADAFAARLQAATDQLKAELADVQNARGTTVALAQAGSQIAWGAPVVSAVVTGGFVGIVGIMTVHAIPDSAVANVLVGTLATAFGSVVNYWLGSSAGSRAKTQMLAASAPLALSPLPPKHGGK